MGGKTKTIEANTNTFLCRVGQTTPETGRRSRTPSDCQHSRSRRGERGNLWSGLDAAGKELRRHCRCGCIPSKAVIVYSYNIPGMKFSSKTDPPFGPKCKDCLHNYMDIARLLHFREYMYLVRCTTTRIIRVQVREYRQIPSLEPYPRRVLRSLGQDSGPASNNLHVA